MLILFSVFVISLCLYFLYSRYVPVKGIPCIDANSHSEQKKVKLDIRDYNIAAKQMVDDSIVMPIAYLKRYHHEIPGKEIHVIASDHMEKNLGIRFLHNKGFKVVGYTLTNCICKD
ncbi:hypothetical protein [Aquibacillus kalidii]|uniref:hypothetical protein n=1 Tax=Aquibacillus kalidii TaxID=2762597 RepID=UPI001C99A466|nr:hypothetical protein [Aquibacillus kalidii]